MSASTEKKNRIAAREAGTDKKAIAAREEAEKKHKSKIKWTVGTIIVVLLIALVLFANSSFLYTHGTAVTVGDESYSPAELSYYVGSQYYSFINNYGSYASYFGLDTSAGIAGLASQPCYMDANGGSWLDYFSGMAVDQIKQIQALCAYADENGLALTDEDMAAIDAEVAEMREAAGVYGFRNVNALLSAQYGSHMNEKLYRELSAKNALAGKAYNAYVDSLSYTDAELEQAYKDADGAYDIFDYAYYAVAAETVETTDADGNAKTSVSDDTMAAAKATADAILDAYKSGEDQSDDYAARLTAAAAAEVEGAEAISTSSAGSNLNAYADWMMGKVKPGDATVIENANQTGYNVVVFISRNDNHYNTANVRHILVKAEADETGAYTKEALAEAKKQAEDIYAQWKSGAATEDSFAELANEYSADGGSNTNGGLYENLSKGQTVPEFDAFCFADGRKSGDTDIVYGESSSYAGYHVMYYVGQGELYSSYIVKSQLMNEAVSEWLTGLTADITSENGYFHRLVG